MAITNPFGSENVKPGRQRAISTSECTKVEGGAVKSAKNNQEAHGVPEQGRFKGLRGFSGSTCWAFESEPNPFLSFPLWQLCHPQIALDLFEADDNPVQCYVEYRVPGIVPRAPV